MDGDAAPPYRWLLRRRGRLRNELLQGDCIGIGVLVIPHAVLGGVPTCCSKTSRSLEVHADIVRFCQQELPGDHGFVKSYFTVKYAVYKSVVEFGAVEFGPCHIDEMIAHPGHHGAHVYMVGRHIYGRHWLSTPFQGGAVYACAPGLTGPRFDFLTLGLVHDIKVEVIVREVINARWYMALRVPVQQHPFERGNRCFLRERGYYFDVLGWQGFKGGAGQFYTHRDRGARLPPCLVGGDVGPNGPVP
jgi:hypothetical protein